MFSLDNMALFIEVGKARSFRAAADSLKMPISTLSRRINELEQQLGLRLLNRTTRKMELTEAGKIYFERCYHLVQEAAQIHYQLGEMFTQPKGLLRIATAAEFASLYLTPLLPEFCERYPDIEFEFQLSPEHIDLVKTPVDLALRIGELQDSHYIARKLTALSHQLYAAPSYLERHGTPQHPQDLLHHQCFPRVMSQRNWWLHKDNEVQDIPIQCRFKSSNLSLTKDLVLAGFGIMLVPEAVVQKELAEGKLVKILPDWFGDEQSVYAITENRLVPAKTQAFIEFLKGKFEERE